MAQFVEAAKANAERIREYKPLADGTDGGCDCIGLIIGAKRLAGGEWSGIHSCNYAARKEMRTFDPIISEADFFLGEVIFKAREPDEDGYELAERYRRYGANYSGDLRDYFHIGLVVDTDPLTIIHCTTLSPLAVDHEKRRWAYGGALKGIDYSAIGIAYDRPHKKTRIVDDNARRFALMREKPGAAAQVLAEIPTGAQVEVISPGGQWTRIRYLERDGFIANKYLGLRTVTVPDSDRRLFNH